MSDFPGIPSYPPGSTATGDVVGPGSAVDGDVVLFDTTTGKLVKDGGAPAVVVAGAIDGAAAKTTPVDADELGLIDSAASNVLKKVTWANIKATAKALFDTVYVPLTRTVNGHALSADVTVSASDITTGTLPIGQVPTGATGSTVPFGNDSRFFDARTPNAHAASHASAGSDPVTLAESQITGLTADLALKAPLASPALTGAPTAPTATAGDASTTVATTAFVQTAVLQGVAKEAVKYASTGVLPSIIYANGSSGVGATLTGVALAAISLDSSSPSVGDRVLIKNQASTFQNGVYVTTATGSGVAVFVLTRASDFDQSGDIKTGDTVYVSGGSTLAGTTWNVNSPDAPVMGTDPITFAQSSGPGSVTSGNGITVTGASVAIDTSVTVDKTTAQTLTNKTLTSPVVNTPTGIVKGDVGLGNVTNDVQAKAATTITAGTGLTGGGDLSANRSLAINIATDGLCTDKLNTRAAVTGTYTIPEPSTATVHDLTLTGSTTFTMPGAPSSGYANSFTVLLRQDSTGSRVPTFTGAKWPGGVVPTWSTGASKVDVVTFIRTASNWHGSAQIDSR